MKFIIQYSKGALQDIDEIFEYITKSENSSIARSFISGIKNKIKNLSSFPLMYREIKEINKERSLRKSSYRSVTIYYVYDKKNRAVIVSRVISSKRNLLNNIAN